VTARPSLDANELLDAYRSRVERALADAVEQMLYATSNVIAEPVRYAVSAGGKRIRPVLCLIAYDATGHPADGTPSRKGALDVACALELIHTYSLVHDDLPCMDDDDLRRGRPTVHRVFGTARAAVAGAAMIPLAFRLLERGLGQLGGSEDQKRRMRSQLAAGAGGGGMVAGQCMDLAAEQVLVELGALREIHSRKTGALFVAAMRLGAMAGCANDRVVDVLGSYGAAAGLAFQIVDDVLDETGSSAVLGKTAGKDRAQAKSTFPALLGRAEAMRQARTAVETAVGNIAAAGLDPAPFHAIGEFILVRDR
jgi:geranylgeranyl pyrophosphate synthase